MREFRREGQRKEGPLGAWPRFKPLGLEVFTAVVAKSSRMLRCLLKHQPSLTYREFGHNALTLAISYGSAEIVKSLLESNLPVVENTSDFRKAVKMSSGYLQAKHPRVLGFVIGDTGSFINTGLKVVRRVSMLARVSLDYRWKQERDLSHRGLYVELQADQTINDLLVEALGDRFDDPKAPFQPISQVVRLPRNVQPPSFPRNTISSTRRIS